MRRAARAVITAAIFLLSGKAAFAERAGISAVTRPDPASIKVPALPLAFKPGDKGDDYFYFHKKGVSYETAFADLDQCRLYAAATKLLTFPPKFVPLGTDLVSSGKTVPAPGIELQYGVVGVMFMMAVVEWTEDANAEAINRRCMGYKGYTRYATVRAAFKQMNAGSDAERLARWALAASGPEPTGGEVGP